MMDMMDGATKLRSMGKALNVGGRAAMAKPSWTARATGWSAPGSPLWPWERRQAKPRFSSLLPDTWPWERQHAPRRFNGILPDAWPWQQRHALRRFRGMVPDTWPWERQQALRRVSSMVPDTWPWERQQAPRRVSDVLPDLHMPDVQLRERSRIEPWQLLAAAALGGTLVYFFDPVMGNRRRKMAQQRTAGALRRWTRSLGRTRRKMGDDISGKRQALMHGHDAQEPMDDVTLAHKVESVLFRDPHVPKGRININAEHGVVVLRGEVEQPSEMHDIERTVRDIAGVHEVRSLLHLASSQG